MKKEILHRLTNIEILLDDLVSEMVKYNKELKKLQKKVDE